MQGKMVNRRRARVVLGGALILLVGCSQSRKTDEQLDQARTALAAARYDQCARLLEPAFREGIPRRDLAEALYMRAQCRVRSGAREAARQDLRRALTAARTDALRALIRAQSGNLHFDDGAYAAAAGDYGRALNDLPRRPPIDRVMHQYATALERVGKTKQARRVRAELRTDFPRSRYVTGGPVATATARSSGGGFAIQCGAFARSGAAGAVSDRLRARGFAPRVVTQPSARGTRHVVRVGRYASRSAARGALARVRGVIPDAFIVTE
jgi:tetratricopeptide (TPR) repeat protein